MNTNAKVFPNHRRVTYSIDTLGLKKESAIAIDISMDVNVVVIYLAIVIAGVIYSIDTLGLKKESAIAIDMPMVVNVVVIYLAIVIADREYEQCHLLLEVQVFDHECLRD
ncbi:hypothetical protein P3S67_011886 [Capsicum chacoense]